MDSAIADCNTYVFLFYVSGSLLLHVYKYTTCVPVILSDQTKASYLLELEF